MKISTQTDHLARLFGEEEAIRILAEVGFDAYDFSMFDTESDEYLLNRRDYEKEALRLKRISEENNIECNQSHAPFPTYLQNNKEYNDRIFSLLVRSIEITGLLGGKVVVIHPAVFPGHKIGENPLCFETNMELYNSLLPYARDCNVKIAVENMFNWYEGDDTASPATCSTPEEFSAYLDALWTLDADHFVACLDIGHSEMKNSGGESAAKMIRTLGHDKLKALHIHDNNLVRDVHTLPFTQKINWDEVMTALKDIQYDGDFTFEADNFIKQFPGELAKHALKLKLEVGRYFIKKYDLNHNG